MLLEKESVIMYLNKDEISNEKSNIKLLADVGIVPENRYQIIAFDVDGKIYKAEQKTEHDVYRVTREIKGEVSHIFEKFQRTEKELNDALEFMDHTEHELNDLKEKVKFIAAAYINAYIKNGALLKKSSDDIELLESLNIIDILEKLSNLFNITKKPILNSQKLYNKYHNEHFILLTMYKGLSRSYGINEIPHIVVIDEYKHRDRVYFLDAIKNTVKRYEDIKECEEAYNYYKSRMMELEQLYSK